MQHKYYEAYDDRYRQVHSQNLQWFDDEPTAIVRQIISKYGISYEDPLLELGCGEGRDAFALLQAGYNLLATDISAAAIDYCRKNSRFFLRISKLWIVLQENWNGSFRLYML